MLITAALSLWSASLTMTSLLFFSPIEPFNSHFGMLLLLIWFVSSKFCLWKKSVTVSKTLFLFLGRSAHWVYLYFQLQIRLNLARYRIIISVKTSFCLSFLVKTCISLFISFMLNFGFAVNSGVLSKGFIWLEDKVYTASLIF